ncbi:MULTISPECIES: hypothetical protein [unclassified Coleofasciculus]|nr:MULTISPECIES: hypothetical protein [unclassified Coleofasciculus]MBD1895069.1 hypothetical protein [Coleofasciculus sp. FACHB-129]MBD2542223.1 hypothetical protein [Coleofasciculus sp. FACHB-SPT36]
MAVRLQRICGGVVTAALPCWHRGFDCGTVSLARTRSTGERSHSAEN